MTQDYKEKNQSSNTEESFDDLIQKKFEAEQQLREKFTRVLTLMATDIRGSTELQRTRGDLAGAAMLSAHNRILEPILEKHGGKILSITDGAFVSFDSGVEEAVKAAIEFMQEVHEYNSNTPDKLNIRIALNHGPVIVKGEKKIEGLAVSTTARVEGALKAFEQKNKEIGKMPLIFISQTVYEGVRNSEDIICRWSDKVEAKGIDKPLDLYRVVWNPELEQAVTGAGVGSQTRGKGRGHADAKLGLASARKSRTIYVIEITKGEGKLKVSGYEKSELEQKTVRPYKDRDVDQAKLDNYIAEIINLLKRATQPGKISKEILNELKTVGQALYEALFTDNVKEQLAATKAEDLILNIDDQLVQIPWELLYDGNSFLSLRFNIGRVVRTRQEVSEGKPRPVSMPLKMLVLADPKNNLKAAAKEGINIRNKMESISSPINTNVKTGNIKSSFVLEKIRNFDIVHYAGHADHDADNPSQSGWLLEDGKLPADKFKKMMGPQPMPALVFSNACNSGQTGEWKIPDNCEDRVFGMANAFLLTGVRHYIGTFWEIMDEPSSYFSLTFYEQLSKNKTIGESVRQARKALIKKYGEETIVWASYMLYGDPSFTYVRAFNPEEVEDSEPGAETENDNVLAAGSLRSGDTTIFPSEEPKKAGALYYWLGAVILIAIGLLFFRQTQQTEKLATSVQTTQDILVQQQAREEEDRLTAEKTQKQQMAIVENEKKGQRISGLVADLAQRYREGKMGTKGQAVMDEWTSRPLVISLFPLKTMGKDSSVSPDTVLLHFSELLGEESRLRLVDRELIDSLLEELQLSSSDLADKKTALRIGRLVGARFIASGNIFSIGKETRISMKLLETETSSIIKSASSTKKGAEFIQDQTASITGKLVEALTAQFPLRGKILGFVDEKVIVNIGKNHGVEKGVKFQVFQEKLVEGTNVKVKVKAGVVEVTDIDADTFMGTTLEKASPLEKEMKVEEQKNN